MLSKTLLCICAAHHLTVIGQHKAGVLHTVYIVKLVILKGTGRRR